MTVRSPLDVLAIVLGLLLLVIIVIFGAIVDAAYRGRRYHAPGQRFLDPQTTAPRMLSRSFVWDYLFDLGGLRLPQRLSSP